MRSFFGIDAQKKNELRGVARFQGQWFKLERADRFFSLVLPKNLVERRGLTENRRRTFQVAAVSHKRIDGREKADGRLSFSVHAHDIIRGLVQPVAPFVERHRWSQAKAVRFFSDAVKE